MIKKNINLLRSSLNGCILARTNPKQSENNTKTGDRFKGRYAINADFLICRFDNDEQRVQKIIDMFLQYKKDSNNKLILLIIYEELTDLLYKKIADKNIKIIERISNEDECLAYENALATICSSNEEIEKVWDRGMAIIADASLMDQCIKSNSGLYYSNYNEFVECIETLYSNRDYRNTLAANGKKYIHRRNRDKYLGICLLSRDYPTKTKCGDAGRYAYELAHSLVGLGQEVHIITEGNIRAQFEDGIYLHYIEKTSLDPIKLPSHYKITRENIEYSYAAYNKLTEIISRYRIDVIEAPLRNGEAFVKSLDKNIPLIVMVHAPLNTEKNGINKDLQRAMDIEIATAKNADKIITFSSDSKDIICKTYGVNEKSIEVVKVDENAKKTLDVYRQLMEQRNKINFDEACERFAGIFKLLDSTEKYIDFKDKIVLDVGCGTGVGAISLIKKGAQEVTGIDINFEEFGYSYFNEIAEIQNVKREKIIFIEGNICDDDVLGPEVFDIILSVDTFEHISDPETALRNCKKHLKPDGYIVIAVSPLYYSPIGSHLWPYFPKENEPWAHLRYDDVTKVKTIKEWHLKHFHNLNKLTIDKMRKYIKQLNLQIILESIGKCGEDLYEKYKAEIDLNKVPQKDDLFIESLLYIIKKI
jgi:2-polyprenyl-3-methyl-5-hydroxy-6-metoxy-1,4-benzoquinol methylase